MAAWLLTELGLKKENNIKKKKKAGAFGDVDINMAWGKKKPSGTTGYVPGLWSMWEHWEEWLKALKAPWGQGKGFHWF